MTGHDLLAMLASRPEWLIGLFAGLPLVALVLGWLIPRGCGNDAPWKFVWSLLVYLTCIPGTLGALVVAYFLLFSRENLLDQNLLVTLVPAASMVATLLIAGRRVDFGPLPGFDRISGLMTMLGLTFLVLYALSRLHLLVVFGGSIWTLVALGVFVFVLIRWGAYRTFRRRDEPRDRAPHFDGE